MSVVSDWRVSSVLAAERGWSILRRDAVSMLASIPNASVDMISTDPAYESLEKHRAAGGTTGRLIRSEQSSNDWFPIFHNHRFPELLAHMYRVLKRDRHAYIMCDDDTSDVLKPMAKAAGFRVWSRLAAVYGDDVEPEPGSERLLWDKKVIGMGYHWRSRHEFILFLEKGKRRLNNLGWPNVIECKRVMRRGAYPTEKPEELYERLLLNSTQPGELILDPFCGSGSGGAAAIRQGRIWIGSDISPEAMRRSAERCMEAERCRE